jgi:hypothetical protein
MSGGAVYVRIELTQKFFELQSNPPQDPGITNNRLRLVYERIQSSASDYNNFIGYTDNLGETAEGGGGNLPSSATGQVLSSSAPDTPAWVTAGLVWYAQETGSADSTSRSVTVSGCNPVSGTVIAVRFQNGISVAGTASSPSLSVNGTSASIHKSSEASGTGYSNLSATDVPANHTALLQYSARTIGSPTSYWMLLNPAVVSSGGGGGGRYKEEFNGNYTVTNNHNLSDYNGGLNVGVTSQNTNSRHPWIMLAFQLPASNMEQDTAKFQRANAVYIDGLQVSVTNNDAEIFSTSSSGLNTGTVKYEVLMFKRQGAGNSMQYILYAVPANYEASFTISSSVKPKITIYYDS